MNREEIEMQMAEYLAGEMPADQRVAFEEQLARDPALKREVTELQRAQLLVAALQVPVTPQRTIPQPQGTRRTVMRWATAAAVMLAFLAGYGVRGPTPAGPHENPVSADPMEASQQAVIRALGCDSVTVGFGTFAACSGNPER